MEVSFNADKPSKSPFYSRWYAMIQRCTNPRFTSYENYGGRGIDVCAGWSSSLESYSTDIGEQPAPMMTVDRIDNDRGYHCGHCEECVRLGRTRNWKWSTRKEQQSNRRISRFVTIDGERATVSQWAERNGIQRATAFSRIEQGWDPAIAVTEPVRAHVTKRNWRKDGPQTVDFHGRHLTLTELAKETGLPRNVLTARICFQGWSVDRATSTPVRPNRRKAA